MNTRQWRRDLQASLLPWAVTRAVVLLALGATRFVRNEGKLAPTVPPPSLFEWDASFYRDIARHGYGAVAARDGLRFFPLYPLLARAFGGRDIVLLLIANLGALVFLVLLRPVARAWVDDRTAERAIWFVALAPGALATVMGYAESLYLVLAAIAFLALLRGESSTHAVRWCLVGAVAGGLAALTRPVGVLLAIAYVVEGLRRRSWPALLAAAGPVLGLLAFLGWSDHAGYGFTKPLKLQNKTTLRGKTVDPVRALVGAAHDVIRDHRVGPGLHLAWALFAIVLVVLAFRRLPLGPALYAAAAIVISLTSRNLDSFERYTLAAFPIYVAGASVRLHRDVDRAVIALLTTSLVVTSLLAFTTTLIP
jgi:hypothetical protein